MYFLTAAFLIMVGVISNSELVGLLVGVPAFALIALGIDKSEYRI